MGFGWGTWIRTKAARSRAGSSTAKLSPTRDARDTTSKPTPATYPGCTMPPSRRTQAASDGQHSRLRQRIARSRLAERVRGKDRVDGSREPVAPVRQPQPERCRELV